MTTPNERSRSVVQAGAFLKELRANTDLPEPVRTEARRLLRHYPSVSNVEFAATLNSHSPIMQNPFGGPTEPDWWSGYRFGPVTGLER